MNKDELIKLGKQWLKHSPPATKPQNEDLIGFSGNINVCQECSGRILNRGCNLKQLADTPIWKPATFTCDLCGKNINKGN
jgi:hypothetical protein